MTGACDPYVVVQLTGIPTWQTDEQKNTMNPVWEQVWETEIEVGVHTSAVLKIYDKNVGIDR